MNPLDIRIQAALQAYDEDCRWELVDGIVSECHDKVLEAGRNLLNDGSTRARTLGADIMGRLAASDAGMRDEIVHSLTEALGREREPGCLASVIAALGHTADTTPLPHIVGLAGHSDPGVRLAVAFAVATTASDPLDRESRYTLIKLSGDGEPEVRDWATFGLGRLIGDDGPDVRAALLARAEDSQRTTRAEALFGLAVRRDPRAVPHLIRALQSPGVGPLELDAAAEAADPRLLPALWALRRAGLGDAGRVLRAIDRCSEKDRAALA